MFSSGVWVIALQHNAANESLYGPMPGLLLCVLHSVSVKSTELSGPNGDGEI